MVALKQSSVFFWPAIPAATLIFAAYATKGPD